MSASFNYSKIAIRTILRNKTNSIINIGGLAIGLTAVFFIVLYITDELSFDKSIPAVNRIYQVNLEGNFGGQQFNTSNTPPPVGAALHDQFPEVTAFTRIFRFGNEVVRNASTGQAGPYFTETRLLATDTNFLAVFGYPMLTGDRNNCLSSYHAIVLTESTARKYFGKDRALGQALSFDEYNDPFIVSAVVKDPPVNSTLQFDMLISTADVPPIKRFSWSWVWCQMSTYVMLDEKAARTPHALEQLQAKFPAMVRKDAAAAFDRIGQPYDEFIRKGGKWDFYLQPFTDIHLYSSGISMPVKNLGDIKYIYIFGIIGLFIVALACINFMNLSTAQGAKRAREVGVRKVLGSMKSGLIRQFLSEAMLNTAAAALIALILTGLLMPAFNGLAGKSLHLSDLLHHGIPLYLLLIFLITGILAGSYPAFYLTKFNPVEVLKGSGPFVMSTGNRFIRNGLVVFQFSIAIVLIVCTLVVFRQLAFMQQTDLGLKKDNIIIIPNIEKLSGSPEALREQISRIPGVEEASISTGMPADDYGDFTDFYVPEKTGVSEPLAKDLTLSSFMVDEHFIPSLHLQLLKGRNFSPAYNDSNSVILNETAVRQAGWKDALGKTISYPGRNNQRFTIIGIVRDFRYRSLHNEVEPFALFHPASKTYHARSSYILASISSNSMTTALRQIETRWKAFDTGIPFDYSFLDKTYEALYGAEQRMGRIFTVFTTLAILIACLGLFGLSVYTAERRVREIGIRKILGASASQITILLTREFLKLVLISAIVAFPLAWWAMSIWLQNFVLRSDLSAWVFLLPALAAILIALFTISFQAVRAALANPAKSLRSE